MQFSNLLYFHKFCLKKEESQGGLKGGGVKDSHLIYYICDTAYKYTFDDFYVPFIFKWGLVQWEVQCILISLMKIPSTWKSNNISMYENPDQTSIKCSSNSQKHSDTLCL